MIDFNHSAATTDELDCSGDPASELTRMFFDIVQRSRMDVDQMPALRPVFLNTHGSAKGRPKLDPTARSLLPDRLFPSLDVPAWIRFSSGTISIEHGSRKTLGIGLKLFGVAGETLFGDTGDGCAFTKETVADRNTPEDLCASSVTDQILNDMEKPEASALSAHCWTFIPQALRPKFTKLTATPELSFDLPAERPQDPDYLTKDLEERLVMAKVHFKLRIQFYSDNMPPCDSMMQPWPEPEHPTYPVGIPTIDQQGITTPNQAEIGENLSYNNWHIPETLRTSQVDLLGPSNGLFCCHTFKAKPKQFSAN